MAKTPRTNAAPAVAPAKTDESVTNDVLRLEVARELPEITGDATTAKPAVAEGAIERFYSADGRLMAVVALNGELRSIQIAEPTDTPASTEA